MSASAATHPDAIENDIDARPRAGRAGLWLALRDIKLAHSVFALPFAVLAAFMASSVTGGGGASGGAAAAGTHGRTDGSWGVFAGQLALVVLCMVFARTWAMLVNRLADREFDAANPRTARRAFAAARAATGSSQARRLTPRIRF